MKDVDKKVRVVKGEVNKFLKWYYSKVTRKDWNDRGLQCFEHLINFYVDHIMDTQLVHKNVSELDGKYTRMVK